MYLDKQEIKSNFQPHEKKLKFLFDNKKIEEFIVQVQRAQNAQEQVSQFCLRTSQHFQSLLKKNERAIQILRSSKEGWKINKIDEKSELAVKVTGTNVELRYEGLLSMNIQNLCIMINQVNLYHNWVPFCTIGEDISEVSPLEHLCYLQFKMPFLTQRYAYFYGLGIDRIDQNDTIVIYGQGISQNEQMLKKFNIVPDMNKIKDRVVLDLKFFICEISYKSQNEFLFRSYCELDSRMPILPEWLVKAVIKQMGGFIFDRVIKQSQKFKGSIYEEQMNKDKNNVFYPWLKNRISAWHQKKKKQATSKGKM